MVGVCVDTGGPTPVDGDRNQRVGLGPSAQVRGHRTVVTHRLYRVGRAGHHGYLRPVSSRFVRVFQRGEGGGVEEGERNGGETFFFFFPIFSNSHRTVPGPFSSRDLSEQKIRVKNKQKARGWRVCEMRVLLEAFPSLSKRNARRRTRRWSPGGKKVGGETREGQKRRARHRAGLSPKSKKQKSCLLTRNSDSEGWESPQPANHPCRPWSRRHHPYRSLRVLHPHPSPSSSSVHFPFLFLCACPRRRPRPRFFFARRRMKKSLVTSRACVSTKIVKKMPEMFGRGKRKIGK